MRFFLQLSFVYIFGWGLEGEKKTRTKVKTRKIEDLISKKEDFIFEILKKRNRRLKKKNLKNKTPTTDVE